MTTVCRREHSFRDPNHSGFAKAPIQRFELDSGTLLEELRASRPARDPVHVSHSFPEPLVESAEPVLLD